MIFRIVRHCVLNAVTMGECRASAMATMAVSGGRRLRTYSTNTPITSPNRKAARQPQLAIAAAGRKPVTAAPTADPISMPPMAPNGAKLPT